MDQGRSGLNVGSDLERIQDTSRIPALRLLRDLSRTGPLCTVLAQSPVNINLLHTHKHTQPFNGPLSGTTWTKYTIFSSSTFLPCLSRTQTMQLSLTYNNTPVL